MSRKTMFFFAAGVLLAILLAACTATPTPTPTPVPPTATPVPSGAPASPALSGIHRFQIVPAESEAHYIVDEEFFAGALDKLGIKAGKAKVVGKTQEISGQLVVDFDNLAAPLHDSVITVNIATLETDQNRRDRWIRENGPRLGSYPEASFVAHSIRNGPAQYIPGEEVSFQLTGDLTIREISQPVTFDVQATMDGNTLHGTAVTDLRMSDFGIEPPSFANTLTVQDAFSLEIIITANMVE